MDDDFHSSGLNSSAPSAARLSMIWTNTLSVSIGILVAILVAPFAIAVATRYLSEKPSKVVNGRNERTVWIVPYWFPIIGHGFSLLVF